MKQRKMFKCAFHIALIISSACLTACGYKGPPVYKESNNKIVDYNSTQPVIPSNLNQY